MLHKRQAVLHCIVLLQPKYTQENDSSAPGVWLWLFLLWSKKEACSPNQSDSSYCTQSLKTLRGTGSLGLLTVSFLLWPPFCYLHPQNMVLFSGTFTDALSRGQILNTNNQDLFSRCSTRRTNLHPDASTIHVHLPKTALS